jgi:hypothetical protein
VNLVNRSRHLKDDITVFSPVGIIADTPKQPEQQYNGDIGRKVASELFTEQVIVDILRQSRDEGIFVPLDPQLTAGVIKAMLQDWYLKRWKYTKRKISVDQYARFVMDFVEAYCLSPGFAVSQA